MIGAPVTRVANAPALSIFTAFLRLGLTSFGGPVAHLGYFRETFVARKRWLDDAHYGDIVALCQVLPGPASSQAGMMIGLSQAGIRGALAAWLGFTLPSAILMVACAYGIAAVGTSGDMRWLHGLAIVAVAVVAQAVMGMARMLCRDRPTIMIALLSTVAALTLPGAGNQDIVMILAAITGYGLYHHRIAPRPPIATKINVGKATGLVALVLFVILLFGLPLLQTATGSPAVGLLGTFYRAGALVFGGSHVVLPLLAAETVAKGAVTRDDFLAGYALAQAVPGPLFTVAGYLGTLMSAGPQRWLGGVLALFAIFAPSFLLVVGIAPFWLRWGQRSDIRAALTGVNAAVVGLLAAALYTPLATSAIHGPADVALTGLAFVLLTRFAAPAWLLVGFALVGWRLFSLRG